MRIYEGTPRQDFEAVFRALGAFLDAQHMREILLLETADGFIVHGLAVSEAPLTKWGDSPGQFTKEHFTFLEEDVARLMEEGVGRRRVDAAAGGPTAGYYEQALRVLGRYLDEQKPRDVFFFEQDGAFVVRLLMSGQSGNRHKLVEFTRDDIAELVARAPVNRYSPQATTSQSS